MTSDQIAAQRTPLDRIQELAEAQRILARARMATADGPGKLPYRIVFNASQYIGQQIDELWAAEICRPLDTRDANPEVPNAV